MRGCAVQCRITTEDPANGFRPDTGTIATYQSPGGPGVRLDGAVYAGAEITPYFDSLLVKLTTRAPDLRTAANRTRRALREFRVRGVKHQRRVPLPAHGGRGLPVRRGADVVPRRAPPPHRRAGGHRPHDPDARRAGRRDRQRAAAARPAAARPGGQAARPAGRAAGAGLAPAARRGRAGALGAGAARAHLPRGHRHDAARRPPVAARHPPAHHRRPRRGARRRRGCCRACCRSRRGAARRTTWRCASCTRTRGSASPQLREAAPDVCLQMLLRGRNAVGYTPYPDRVVQVFVAEAAATGVDVFRVFDALNDLEQMRPALDAVREAGKVAEGTLCYTGDLTDPAERLYTLDYYLRLAEQLVEAGAHVLAVKDMAGLLRPARRRPAGARRCAAASTCRCTCTPTTRPAGSSRPCSRRATPGSTRSTRAMAPMSGGTSQPNMSALVAATDHTERVDRAVADGAVGARALLGGGARPLRAVRGGPAGADRHRLPPRDPGRPAHQPAPAGDRDRPRRPLGGRPGAVRRRQRAARQADQGDADEQGRRRPRASSWPAATSTSSACARTRGRTTCRPACSATSPASSARRRPASPSRSAPRRSPGRAEELPEVALDPADDEALDGPRAPGGAVAAAVPRAVEGLRAGARRSTATSR